MANNELKFVDQMHQIWADGETAFEEGKSLFDIPSNYAHSPGKRAQWVRGYDYASNNHWWQVWNARFDKQMSDLTKTLDNTKKMLAAWEIERAERGPIFPDVKEG